MLYSRIWLLSHNTSLYKYIKQHHYHIYSLTYIQITLKILHALKTVPGDGGSQVDARLNKSSSPNVLCAKNSDWFNLWLNLELIVIPAVYCWVDNVKLYYDNITRTTHNTPGVEIRIPGWGNPEVVEWIDPTHNKAGAYFRTISSMLVDYGYVRNKNIRGAPYDFRKAPSKYIGYS